MTNSIHDRRVSNIIALAENTFGDDSKVALWLTTPNSVLDNQKPLDILSTSAGAESVTTVLGRIAYGLYS